MKIMGIQILIVLISYNFIWGGGHILPHPHVWISISWESKHILGLSLGYQGGPVGGQLP